MMIKVHTKPTGIPNASTVVADGETALGARQITMFVYAHDAWDMKEVCASLRLSPDEARDLAARLIKQAEGTPRTP